MCTLLRYVEDSEISLQLAPQIPEYPVAQVFITYECNKTGTQHIASQRIPEQNKELLNLKIVFI